MKITDGVRSHRLFLHLASLDWLQLFNLRLFYYHHVLFWVVTETRVRVLRSVLVFPRLEVGVLLLTQHELKVVLQNYITGRLVLLEVLLKHASWILSHLIIIIYPNFLYSNVINLLGVTL
jgi:hypothetical protein